jgi:hypothetical protein
MNKEIARKLLEESESKLSEFLTSIYWVFDGKVWNHSVIKSYRWKTLIDAFKISMDVNMYSLK